MGIGEAPFWVFVLLSHTHSELSRTSGGCALERTDAPWHPFLHTSPDRSTPRPHTEKNRHTTTTRATASRKPLYLKADACHQTLPTGEVQAEERDRQVSVPFVSAASPSTHHKPLSRSRHPTTPTAPRRTRLPAARGEKNLGCRACLYLNAARGEKPRLRTVPVARDCTVRENRNTHYL